MQDGQVVAYMSCHLKDHKREYPTHHLELPVVVFALKSSSTIYMNKLVKPIQKNPTQELEASLHFKKSQQETKEVVRTNQ